MGDMSVDSLAKWAALIGGGERVEFVCAEAPEPERGHRAWKPVRVPGCVVGLQLHVPVEMLALGVAEVGVRVDGCARRAQLDERIELWNSLLQLAGRSLAEVPTGRRRRELLDAERMPTVERRTVLLLGKKHRRPDDAWRPDTLDTTQQRLRSALLELGAVPTEAGEAAGVGMQVVANGCEAQIQCVRACPNQALKLTHEQQGGDDQRTRLLFDASLCDGCGRCVDFCDRDALSFAGQTSLNDVVAATPSPIADFKTRRCERCRTAFVPKDDERACAVCEARWANPFGSSLPPEAIERLKRMRG